MTFTTVIECFSFLSINKLLSLGVPLIRQSFFMRQNADSPSGAVHVAGTARAFKQAVYRVAYYVSVAAPGYRVKRLLAASAAVKKSRILQQLKMVAYRGRGHSDFLGNGLHACFAVAQIMEYAQPRSVRKQLEAVGGGRIDVDLHKNTPPQSRLYIFCG